MQISDLRLIEIELFSYCNRKCAWCPNSFIDRDCHKPIEFLDLDILCDLVIDLSRANYKNYISFSRYNEPFSHIQQFKSRVEFIKRSLPEATLVTNTNGDYLSEENLQGLFIDELTIMDYDCRGLYWCLKKLIQCNCEIDNVKNQYIYAHYDNMKIIYYVDWPKHSQINDRGGSLNQYSLLERNRPCLEPQYFIGINYDGTVSPCCNIRNDIEQHQEYIMGNLNSTTLTSIITSPKFESFRDVCAAGRFEEGSPCYYCQNGGGRYTRDKGGIDYV